MGRSCPSPRLLTMPRWCRERCPHPARPRDIERPEYVGQAAPRRRYTGPEVKDAETIERMRVAGRIAAQALAEVGQPRRAGCHDRRARPGRPRVPVRPRRLPVDARLQGLPQVAVHLGQRGDLPRHPGHDRPERRRHRQRRHHGVHRRRARRHRRDLPGRRRRRGVTAAGRAHPRGDDAGDQGGRTRPAGQRDRPGDRVLREAVRLRRGARLHRARHRHGVPLRAGHPPLRRPVLRHGDGGRA